MKKDLGLLLTRDFIRKSLYEGYGSYFQKGDVVAPFTSLNFQSLRGKSDYELAVRVHYDTGGRGWLTPSEIFQPYYGYAIANKVVNRFKTFECEATLHPRPLIIYEVGGGSGIVAADILDWLRRVKPSIYSTCEYTILEISNGLHERQKKILSSRGHSQRAKSILVDATDLRNANSSVRRDNRFCIVIGLEVLDNLPHDKIVYCDSNEKENIFETRIIDLTETYNIGRKVLSETYVPLSDDLIKTVYNIWQIEHEKKVQQKRLDSQISIQTKIASSVRERGFIQSLMFGLHTALLTTGETVIKLTGVYPPGSRASFEAKLASLRPSLPDNFKSAHFLPTGCFSLLKSLEDVFPRHELILSDFDTLPPASLSLSKENLEKDTHVICYAPAISGEPLVSSKNASFSQDHVTYLSAPIGSADIFFQTDFKLLSSFIQQIRSLNKVRSSTTTSNEDGISILSSSDFIKSNIDITLTETRSGWNPLLEDFSNVKVLST
jgi:hypothetical protein